MVETFDNCATSYDFRIESHDYLAISSDDIPSMVKQE